MSLKTFTEPLATVIRIIGSSHRTGFLVAVIIATEIVKCATGILFIVRLYPFDLSQWMHQVYPPWQRIDPPAPYGLPWYLLYGPGLAGFTALVIWLALAETLTMLFLLNKGNRRLLYLYMGTSSFFFFWAIFDLWLLMLIVLAARWQGALVLGAFVKLPLGAPFWVWEFIWKASLAQPGNWLHYIVIAAWWFGMLYHTRPRITRLPASPDSLKRAYPIPKSPPSASEARLNPDYSAEGSLQQILRDSPLHGNRFLGS